MLYMLIIPPLLSWLFSLAIGTTTVTNNEISTGNKRKCSAAAEQEIHQCLQPILLYANSIQETTEGAHFSLQGGDVFKKLCALYHNFKECTKEEKCTSISVDAVEASYGYMCGAGYNLFEQHASCFAEVETQPEYVTCRNVAGKAMDDALKAKRDDVDVYFHKLCAVMDQYLRCCRPFVSQKCGPEAWQLVSQVEYNFTLLITCTTLIPDVQIVLINV
jgi:hypothetical protein